MEKFSILGSLRKCSKSTNTKILEIIILSLHICQKGTTGSHGMVVLEIKVSIHVTRSLKLKLSRNLSIMILFLFLFLCYKTYEGREGKHIQGE